MRPVSRTTSTTAWYRLYQEDPWLPPVVGAVDGEHVNRLNLSTKNGPLNAHQGVFG